MSEPRYDVVVVGGGIHGAGVAQAAAAAGHATLLLEKNELAHGTSSRSSKLIHGGLRYLETAQFSLVRESLTERQVLLRIAPDLVRLVPFFLPVYRDTSRPAWKMRVGLSLYALLGGLHPTARFETVPETEWDRLDGLRTAGLRVVFRYWDAQTNDAALTRAVVRSARELGARVLSPARFLSAHRGDGGYRVVYEHMGGEIEVSTRTLVNAAGPWAVRLLDTVSPPPERLPIELVQGAHVELEGSLERGVYYGEAPRDRRAVFIMPWKRRILVGTTETPFAGDPEVVRPTQSEVDYLLETFRHYFPSREPRLVGSFAGLRVLPRQKGPAFGRSRELVMVTDDRSDPRLVTLYGGKLTGYRATAGKVLRKLRRALPVAASRADTATVALRPDDAA